MPVNLPPQAQAAYQKYLEASTPEEQLAALEEFYSEIPKHKGTEKLRDNIKRKIVKLREVVQERRVRKKGGGYSPDFIIRKEGDGQIAVVGMSMCGKTMLLRELSGSTIARSSKPIPVMVNYNGIMFQFIEIPSFYEGIATSESSGPILSLVHNADLIIIVIDGTKDPEYQRKVIYRELELAEIYPAPAPKVVVRPAPDLKITGAALVRGVEENEVYEFVRDILRRGHVDIQQSISLEQLERALQPSSRFIEIVEVSTKEYVPDTIPWNEKERILSTIVEKLGLIRVYTVDNLGKVAEKPLVLKKGATVEDAAKKIHKDLLKYFRFAKIWGLSVKHNGERVGLEHVLQDGDKIQIVAR
ncbi:MAG: TGS domain-containing protein [Candidatus Korarchaeota archaeon]